MGSLCAWRRIRRQKGNKHVHLRAWRGCRDRACRRGSVRRVSLRIVTLPIQSQGIITKDNVSVDVSDVAYYKVVDPVAAVVAIENVQAAIDQIAQTTLRAVVGRHTLDETLSETDTIDQNIREIQADISQWRGSHGLTALVSVRGSRRMCTADPRRAPGYTSLPCSPMIKDRWAGRRPGAPPLEASGSRWAIRLLPVMANAGSWLGWSSTRLRRR
jgi:hypothetical protein